MGKYGRDTRSLDNIKCDFIQQYLHMKRRQPSAFHPPTSKRQANAFYLKLYQDMMLPSVKVHRLTKSEKRQWTRRKSSRAKPKHNGVCDTERMDINESQSGPCAKSSTKDTSDNVSSAHSSAQSNNDSYRCMRGHETHMDVKETLDQNVALHSMTPCAMGSTLLANSGKATLPNKPFSPLAKNKNNSKQKASPSSSHKHVHDKTKGVVCKGSAYATIYKFLKNHKHLQSKLVSPYRKDSKTKEAPFKVKINATASGVNYSKN